MDRMCQEQKLKAHFWIPLMSSEKSEEQHVQAKIPRHTQVFTLMLWLIDHLISSDCRKHHCDHLFTTKLAKLTQQSAESFRLEQSFAKSTLMMFVLTNEIWWPAFSACLDKLEVEVSSYELLWAGSHFRFMKINTLLILCNQTVIISG